MSSASNQDRAGQERPNRAWVAATVRRIQRGDRVAENFELLPVDEDAVDVRGGAGTVTVSADTGGLVLTLAVPDLAERPRAPAPLHSAGLPRGVPGSPGAA